MADISLLVLFLLFVIFVPTEVTFKVVVITSSVAKITLAVDEMTFKVAIINYSVVKITFVVTEITFFSG